jgi:hypothetical protein
MRVVESKEADAADAPKFNDTFCHALSVSGVQVLVGLTSCQIDSSWGLVDPEVFWFFMMGG